MIRHEYPGFEVIPCFHRPFLQNSGYDIGHFWLRKPPRSGRRCIQQTIPCGEGRSAGSPEVGNDSDR